MIPIYWSPSSAIDGKEEEVPGLDPRPWNRKGATMDRRIMPALLAGGLLAACAGQSPQGLGVKSGHLSACPASPNCVASEDADEGHRIAPLAIPDDIEKAWSRLHAVLSNRSDTRIVDLEADYLRAEFRTLLGFVDDAEFLLDREARVIQVRSASRLGYSDLGKNRRRLEEIREAFGRE
jgi:uncharacterized protein (DUF1499 family)